MWMFGGFSIWVVIGVLYGVAVLVCYIHEEARMKRRVAEREERRRIQNAEWEEQLRTNPTLRLILIMSRRSEEERREAREVMRALRRRVPKRKPKVNWKEEGF